MMKYLSLAACTFVVASSCTTHHVGSKVYLEQWIGGARLHIDRNCTNFDKKNVVEYIDTAGLAGHMSSFRLIPYCQKCVTDEDADRINAIVGERE